MSLELSSDPSFHFELLRVLGHSTYHGSDINEVLECAGRIVPGDFESFASTFHDLAVRVEKHASDSSTETNSGKVSVRDALFRAATYYRAADFYLHGDVRDSRIEGLWRKQGECFDKAISLLESPVERVTIKADAFDVPIIFYGPSQSLLTAKKPTIIFGNGFDGSHEEGLHIMGFAALERGFNFITYDGPGQPSVRRKPQELGFIYDWERVVTPVVDWAESNAEEFGIDMDRLGLWGQSLGGYLCVRAAVFEKRIKAVMSIDGLYSFFDPMTQGGKQVSASDALASPKGNMPTTHRWAFEHGLWCFFDGKEFAEGADNPPSAERFIAKAKTFSLEGLTDQVTCPVFVGDAEEDLFFQGQPDRLAKALGDKATLHLFKTEDAAGNHCHAGAGQLMNQVVLDWFERVVSS